MNAGQSTTFRGARLALASTLVAGLCLVATTPASAATIVAGPQAAALNYLLPNVTIAPGESLTFLNLDLVSHDVTSEGTFRPKPRRRPGRRPKPRPPQLLFRSDLIGFGQQSAVTGTERLKPGVSYPYFCSLHPSMTGVVTVN